MILGSSKINSEAFSHNLIQPFDETKLQPASYDLSLAGPFLQPEINQCVEANNTEPRYDKIINSSIILVPGHFILASTLEKVTLPLNISAQISGKSSLGRIGLMIHVTAGWIDPGFTGHITLEISNIGPHRIILKEGGPIAQIIFCYTQDTHFGYKGRYQNQTTTTGARYER